MEQWDPVDKQPPDAEDIPMPCLGIFIGSPPTLATYESSDRWLEPVVSALEASVSPPVAASSF